MYEGGGGLYFLDDGDVDAGCLSFCLKGVKFRRATGNLQCELGFGDGGSGWWKAFKKSGYRVNSGKHVLLQN